MSARPRALVLSPRLVMASATGGLVALASAGTALLVLTGTSAVAPPTTHVPPLPAERPQASRPGAGVVVVPSARAVEPVRAPGTRQRATRPGGYVSFRLPVALARPPVAAPQVPVGVVPLPTVDVPSLGPLPVEPVVEPVVDPVVDPVAEPRARGPLPALRRGTAAGDETGGDAEAAPGAPRLARPQAGKNNAAPQADRSHAAPRAYRGGVEAGQSRAGRTAPGKAGAHKAGPASSKSNKPGKGKRGKGSARSR